MRVKVLFAILTVLSIAAGAAAQGNPTGVIRGVVTDPDGLALPGVTVTVSSPALQGTRSVVTSANGDFLIPFLPPGQYIVTVELQSFATQKLTIGVAMAETQPMAIKLALASVQESVTVTASSSTEVLKTGTIAATYTAKKIDDLPVGRALNDAVLLAPGVNSNGPSSAIVIAGALSYETLYLVNGVNVNENLRGQARLLFVEDAIQETKVSTGNISAEYGRFNGGIVNMVTKSGGNKFSGSFRDTLTNDAWRALRPMNDQKLDQVVPAYEGTFGGPIMRDKLWFFTDGKYQNNQQQRTLNYTLLNYPWAQSDKRYEGKGTWTINPQNTFKGSYTTRKIWTTNNSSNSPMDLASLYNNGTTDGLLALNYASVLSPKLFLEGQFSRKTMVTVDTGSQFTDLVKGTLMFDRSRGSARFNSPTFCAVCGTGWHEERNNWDWFVKFGYFLSTSKTGSHSFVFGFDNFKESRKVDNYQGGSGYRVYVTKTYIGDTADKTLYPVVDTAGNSSYIQYTPLVEPSKGSDIRTYSGFVNDQWRLNNKLTFNAGFRFDLNRSKDQGGVPVLADQQWSPRLGVTYDLKGDGKWIANAGFARYVMGVNGAVVDSGSKGGRTASYSWNYKGPTFNTDLHAPELPDGGRHPPADVHLVRLDRRHQQHDLPQLAVDSRRHDAREHRPDDRPELQRDHGWPGARTGWARHGSGRLRPSPVPGHVRQLHRHDDRQGHRPDRAEIRRREHPQHARRAAVVRRRDGGGQLPGDGPDHLRRQLHPVVLEGQQRRRERRQRPGHGEHQYLPRVQARGVELADRLHDERPAPQGARLRQLAAAREPVGRQLHGRSLPADQHGHAVRHRVLRERPGVRDEPRLPVGAGDRHLLRGWPRVAQDRHDVCH